ncbi:ClC family H(+)/Cl(-) exchange transporter [Lacticaseibacillus saniviri]|uniref:ClC family H(+)/Cl(-) exchange transporter n=1 Tax=Lacticaseibacillus saniviri TaxID=931533 RepID=UPI000AF16D7A|nr:ClC family H(+)/Cl(-) exchange transporter [Lacticaseibacillus saniviri]
MKQPRLRFAVKGLTVGIVVGIVVSSFRWLIEHGLDWALHWYQHFTWPTALGLLGLNLLIGILIAQLLKQEPDIAGSGIPQVEGQLQGELDLSWWSILWRKFVGGILALSAGLFLGREGPSIQLGAAVGQGLSEWQHDRGSDRRIMIASGAAAGLAAAFNAPIAGSLFVLEEIYHNFSPLVWLSSLASAIGANFISLYIFGERPVLHLVYPKALPIDAYWHLLLLGVALGLLGKVYQWVLLRLPDWYALTHIPRRYQGLIPLVAVIPIGFLTPQLLGGGNQLIIQLGQQMPSVLTLLGIFAIRFVFSMVSYGSGLPGGIFLPILSLGAIIGAIYAQSMVGLHLLPAMYAVNFVIFAMAGYFAAIGKAPFTAILLVTEMVGNLKLLMPLAVVALIAYLVLDGLHGDPIYEALLAKLVHQPARGEMGQMARIEVPIFAGSALEEQQVRDIAWPKSALLIGIIQGEKEVLPHGDSVLQAGQTLVVLTAPLDRQRVRRQIRQLATVTKTPGISRNH